jgi:hypothetical protein
LLALGERSLVSNVRRCSVGRPAAASVFAARKELARAEEQGRGRREERGK